MFEIVFYSIYNLVALFYLACGSVLLIYPKVIESKITPLFPLLASWGLSRVRNVFHLVFVGAVLLWIGRLIGDSTLLGYFIASVMSGLEIWLGVKFYYYEEHDIPQSILHIILHTLLVGILIWYIVNTFSANIGIVEKAAEALQRALY